VPSHKTFIKRLTGEGEDQSALGKPARASWHAVVTYLLPAVGRLEWRGEVQARTAEEARLEALAAAGLSEWGPDSVLDVHVEPMSQPDGG